MAKRKRSLRAEKPMRDQKQTARDGFVNTLAYLGEASMLKQASDYERHSISENYEQLTVMYRENWIAKKIIDIPAEDMTRAWYSLASEIEQDKIDELMKSEARHNVKQEITNAIRWARLYGGSAAVMVIKGQEDILDEPLDFDMLMPDCFKGLIVIDKTSGLDPSIELEEDMDDPEYGYPKYYNVITDADRSNYVRIHHSRLLFFRGRNLPIQEEINANFWGASELEHIYEELQKRDATSANIAQLVFQANVAALKMADYGEIMGMGTDAQKAQITAAIEWQNRIRNSFGMFLMGAEDNYEQHPYSFSGLAEVYESFMLDMAGAAEIPATKLYGRSPQGMNATGESDMKNYYQMIAGLQERMLRPALEKLLPVMEMSAWGQVPEDIEVVFESLETTTPAERAQITQQQTGSIIQAYVAGITSRRTTLMELRETGKPIGAWTSIPDEEIENAEEEVDSGEEMQDPMGGMPGMPGMEMPEGGQPPEGPEPSPEGPQGPPDGPEPPSPTEAEEGQAPQQRAPQEPQKAGNEQEPQKAEQRPQEAEEQQELQKDSAELTGWRKEVLEAVQSGDLNKARAIVKAQKEAAQDDQPKPIRSFLRDMVARIRKRFSRDWEESEHPRDKSGKFTSGSGSSGGSSESSGSTEQKPVDYTGIAKPKEAARLKEPEAPKETENKGTEPVDKGAEKAQNKSGTDPSKYYTGTQKEGHTFPNLAGGTKFSSADPKTFRDAVVEAQDSYADADGWRVGPHDEYSDADKCFVSEAGSSTCVAENGDIVSVCKKAGSADKASDLLEQAIANGGNKLDAYGMGLFRLYTSNGFEPCSWCEWENSYAPDKRKSANGLPNDESWFETPDSELKCPREPILFYRYTGKKATYGSRDEIRKAYNAFLSSRPSTGTDYDAAYAQRDDMMRGQEG